MAGRVPLETRAGDTGGVRNISSVTDGVDISKVDQIRVDSGGVNTSRVDTGCANSSGVNQPKNGGEALESALLQLGPFGPYQRYVLTLLCLPNIFAAMYSLNYVFVADSVPFRCLVPECEGAGVSFANASVSALQSSDPCRRYRPLGEGLSCAREDYHHRETLECDVFVYENYDTVYAEFGLACSEWRRTLVGSVRNAALPLALLLTGHVSDRWGRRTAFCVFSGCAGTLGLLKSFSLNYYMYVALEFLEAALGYGFGSAAYVMVVELARPSLRAPFACATGVAYGLGGVVFALLAWRVPRWRWLVRAAYAPALLLPLYRRLIDESPRWLHAAGHTQGAANVLRKAARWNKVTINEDILKSIIANEKNDTEEAEGKKRAVLPWSALVTSRPLLARLAACGWCWAAAAFVYYGLTINSVALSGDKYVNFALNMTMEMVASFLIMMSLERVGRKRTVLVAFLLCGVACITPFFVTHGGAGLGLYFAGKLAATAAFNSLYVFTTELFPTGVRARALTAASLLGRVGSVLAPQTPLLSKPVQALLYAACALSAALALLAVPETRREPLPH
ncbi:PREDICTED: organic cation transporter protein-like [Papilio xuthus]|uniref:Organic cation transporter protein-like n=1 Tax=Papilio xuthus TaxID=66420 RepID=A0AAJ6ZIL9_PAPXU|nr:PREDICTED: organic cation transporter protein-like [Papilio xuthus]